MVTDVTVVTRIPETFSITAFIWTTFGKTRHIRHKRHQHPITSHHQQGPEQMSDYLTRLKAHAVAQRDRHAALQRDRSKSLRERIEQWMGQLPPGERKDRYTMEELVAQIKGSPGEIGRALHELGWHRQRSWKAQGPFSRYWIPPPFTLPESAT
jgi:hypothetical protein